MPRHAMLFAATLAAISLNAAAQTAAPAPPETPLPKKTCARPVYPAGTGTSTIAFLIGVDGLVKDARVLKSSGHDILDEAAKSALELCQFKPARENGKPVQSWQPVQYVWTLE